METSLKSFCAQVDYRRLTINSLFFFNAASNLTKFCINYRDNGLIKFSRAIVSVDNLAVTEYIIHTDSHDA